VGSFRSERENVDEDICLAGRGPFAVEVDLMQPLDPARKPRVNEPPLNHVGLWVDDLAAAVGGVMILALARAGYPAPFSASVIGAAAATDILIPPSIALIIYSVMVPGASVPALFAAGMVPGILAGLALIVPTAQTSTTMATYRINFIDEYNTRSLFFRLLKHVTHS
jgi:hypothetical protein